MVRLACLIAMLMTTAAAQPDEREVRRRTIGGWSVVDVAESDGGQLVRLERRSAGLSLRYQRNYWRGNGGVFLGALAEIGDCSTGDREALVAHDHEEPLDAVQERFRTYFTECGVPQRRQAQLMRGLDRAYCLFRRWSADAAAAIVDENAQIMAYGTGERVTPTRPDYPDCRV